MATGAPLERQGTVQQFFRDTLSAFDRGCSAVGACEDRFLIGGSRVCLRFAGEGARNCVLPGLAHLPAAPGDMADLDLAIWDTATCGIELPATPWPDDALVSRGEIQGLTADPGIAVAFQPGSEHLCMLDRVSARGVLWMPDASRCPYWDRAAPLRTLFHWWFLSQSRQLVHAAAVGDENGALLLTGRGGSGKSTTALTALAAGMHYLGDDYVLCDVAAATPRVFSLYNAAKVDRDAQRRLPTLRREFPRDAPDQDKALLHLYPDFAAQLPAALPLRAIVVPRVTGGPKHSVQRLKAAAALLALAPTTLFQLPGAGGQTLALLRQLASEIPCYALQLGADSNDGLASLLRGLLEKSG